MITALFFKKWCYFGFWFGKYVKNFNSTCCLSISFCLFESVVVVIFKIFFVLKYIKIMFFIFKISTLKRSKIYKKIIFNKKVIFLKIQVDPHFQSMLFWIVSLFFPPVMGEEGGRLLQIPYLSRFIIQITRHCLYVNSI